jgi:hypothetical protein
MVNDCGRVPSTLSLVPPEDVDHTALRDLLNWGAEYTKCISFDGGATLRPTEGSSECTILEFHGASEAAGVFLALTSDGKVNPLRSLAVRYRAGVPDPTYLSKVTPVSYGEGTSVGGEKCSFLLYGLEERIETEGTITIHATSAYVWPPESVVRDLTGKFTLTDISKPHFV